MNRLRTTRMRLNLPEELTELVQPVFDVLPLDRAMARLTPDAPADADAVRAVAEIIDHPQLEPHPGLRAGLWLYVDELDRSHSISQQIPTPTGSYWHAIMHRREGDFSNAKYWYRKAGNHPALRRIDLVGGGAGSGTDVAQYDPFHFVDRVEKAVDRTAGGPGLDGEHPELISLQHREWRTLFEWCGQQ